MSGNLSFDVTAQDSASDEFLAIAAQLRELSKQLEKIDGKKAKATVELTGAEKASAQAEKIRVDVDKLDGRSAKVKVALDAASSAPIERFSAQLRDLDGKTAKANVELTGAESVKAKVLGVLASLKALPNKVAVAVNIDLDKGLGERLAGVSAGLSRFGSIASSAASGAQRFRSAASVLMDPSQLPIVDRISNAISGKFHQAVDVARVGVDKLSTGLRVMRTSLLGIGAAGGAVQVVGGLATSLAQLSGSALLIPAAVGGAAVAVSALKIAFAGFGDAVNADTPKKFAKATADMAPAAKAAVIAVRELKTALSGVGSVGKVVQSNMFDGLAKQVQQLGQTYLPVLRSGLGQTANQLNGMAKAALTAVTSLSAVGQVRTIITNTNVALGNMRTTVANAASGFLTLAAAGSGWLPRFGAAVDAGSAKFANWSKRIVADGSFDRWVTGGITAFKQLGTILGNVGSIAGTVFKALNDNGAGLLATLAGATTQLRTFLQSVQGASALQALGQTLKTVGDAVSRVFGAALKQLGPIMTALAPAAQALATALGANLVSVINAAGPVITRFAQALSANPSLLVGLAQAAGAVVVGFGPMVAIIGVAATLLKGFVIARVAGLALGVLGLQGTVAARVLMALTSPMALLRELFPLIARGAGALAASLGLALGPVGGLIIAFTTLYATSSQFRDAVGGIAQTLGRLFSATLTQAGEAINGTVGFVGDLVSAFQQAVGGITSFGSKIASVFGPLGGLVSGGLSGLFDLLGKLPGTALAAYAAFRVFGLIAPLFTTASLAVAGFSARLLAFQGASGATTVAANAAGAAAGKFGTALSKVGAALPLIGVALIAAGSLYDQFASKGDEAATSVVQGSQSMQRAIQAEADQIHKNQIEWLGGMNAQQSYAAASDEVRGKIEAQLQALNPLDQAQARAKISAQNLSDAILTFGPNSQQASDASRVLARDNADLASKQKILASATAQSTDALKAQADQMQSQIDTALAYSEAVQQTADAQTAAADALKANGAGSKEYKDSVDALVRSMNSQIKAARDNAGALGDTDAATAAYNTEILRTADLSTRAGKDAFTKLVSGLDSTGLAAITSAAKLSKLRTEVVTLPDGRKVTVVVAADLGKLDSVKAGVEELASKKYVGTVTVLATADGAQGAIIQTVALADNSRGTIKIAGDGSPAILTVGQTKYTIDSTTGEIKVLGDVAPGEASLAGLKVHVDSTTGAITITGQNAPANAATDASKAKADSTVGTITLDGDPTRANGKTTQALTYANGAKGTITIDGQPNPATGKINAVVQFGNGRVATISVTARDQASGVIAAIAAVRRVSYIDVYTRNHTGGYVGNGTGARMNAGGGVKGYSGGGIHGTPRHAARGMVLPGYAPGQDTEWVKMSKGEAVLVPELVRALGARRILAANAEASGGRAASVTGSLAGMMDGSIKRYAGGGIRAEDGSTVNADFYSRISPQLRALQDGRGIATGEISPAEWARLSALGWKATSGRLYYPGTGPAVVAAKPAAPKVAAPVARGPGAAQQLNMAPLVGELRAQLGQLRQLTAAVAGGGGYDAAIAANTAAIAANTSGRSNPAMDAQASRVRAELGAFA